MDFNVRECQRFSKTWTKKEVRRGISRPNVSIDSVGYPPSFRKPVKHSSKKLSYPGAGFQSSIRGMKLPRIVLSFKLELALVKKKKKEKERKKERKKREKKKHARLSWFWLLYKFQKVSTENRWPTVSQNNFSEYLPVVDVSWNNLTSLWIAWSITSLSDV